jgi:16S rRNA (guanine527-N7)-methyltransferase
LLKWQNAINLVSQSTLEQLWQRHFIDSSQLLDHIQAGEAVADIGSGAGFPGLVLAILGVEKMTLIESDTRKVAFLREAARQTECEVALINKRVEEVSLREFSTITARGFASVTDMLGLCENTLTPNHKLLLLKGKNYKSEIDSARKAWSFDYHTYPSATEQDGVILSLTHITQGVSHG